MKIFLSQPMRDRSDDEIRLERDNIQAACIHHFGKNAKIIESFFQGAPHDASPVWFLGMSIQLLATADAAFFAPNWEKYRGCRIEHEICKEYGIQIISD